MVNKRILSVGFDFPGSLADYVSYRADQSLLDADIIIFDPSFGEYTPGGIGFESSYQGKPSYGEDESFKLKEDTFRWHRELFTALQEGKTIFVFFAKYQEVFVCTGQKSYSGTGRSRQPIVHVEPFNNYESIPCDLPTIIPGGGRTIISKSNPIFSTFWQEFKDILRYESYFDGKVEIPLFVTKIGDKAVGALFKIGKGHLVFLPLLSYDENKFVKHDKRRDEYLWTPIAIKFGKRLLKIIMDMDESLSLYVEKTTPPEWSLRKEYQFTEESKLRRKINQKSKQIKKFMEEKSDLELQLKETGMLRDLLFEKGTILQDAVEEALKLLGYEVETYSTKELEIDHIIVSPEGNRFIGETEGKDKSAINIDKFRQLQGNIQEDLRREEVEEPATGILFGNGFRLTDPKKRKAQFTEKCTKSTQSMNIILIATLDLFKVAKYLKENRDKEFASACRKVILESQGKLVKFPEPPPKELIEGKQIIREK